MKRKIVYEDPRRLPERAYGNLVKEDRDALANLSSHGYQVEFNADKYWERLAPLRYVREEE